MFAAKKILRRVLGDAAGSHGDPETLTRFEQVPAKRLLSCEDALPEVLPDGDDRMRLSRFAVHHTRAVKAATSVSAPAEPHVAAMSQSNDGTDLIPLSVLQNALPGRFAKPGVLDGRPPVLAPCMPVHEHAG